jgi:hypothetical protein
MYHEYATRGIDTPEDLEAFRARIAAICTDTARDGGE